MGVGGMLLKFRRVGKVYQAMHCSYCTSICDLSGMRQIHGITRPALYTCASQRHIVHVARLCSLVAVERTLRETHGVKAPKKQYRLEMPSIMLLRKIAC